jgi:hypothetical protein
VLPANHPGYRARQSHGVIPELVAPGSDIKGAINHEKNQVPLLPYLQSHGLHAVVQVTAKHLQALSHRLGLHHQYAQCAKHRHILPLGELQRELLAIATLGRQLQQPYLLIEWYQQGRLLDLLQAQPRVF